MFKRFKLATWVGSESVQAVKSYELTRQNSLLIFLLFYIYHPWMTRTTPKKTLKFLPIINYYGVICASDSSNAQRFLAQHCAWPNSKSHLWIFVKVHELVSQCLRQANEDFFGHNTRRLQYVRDVTRPRRVAVDHKTHTATVKFYSIIPSPSCFKCFDVYDGVTLLCTN
jgi:hypothetical protein